ncbi:MAG: hypothetical protein KDB95_13030, partial [Flavobacteriales bacterium]|nr:hypothetical protein [Flavobacteriales bacterium]
HSLFVQNNGTVWGVGGNTAGQLGAGAGTINSLPVLISGLSDIRAVAAGYSHSLFLGNDGTAWGVGGNINGQLGLGNNTSTNVPAPIPGLSGLSAVAAGSDHSLFLTDLGAVRAVGKNTNGQLGDGTNTDRNTPVEVQGLCTIASAIPVRSRLANVRLYPAPTRGDLTIDLGGVQPKLHMIIRNMLGEEVARSSHGATDRVHTFIPGAAGPYTVELNDGVGGRKVLMVVKE